MSSEWGTCQIPDHTHKDQAPWLDSMLVITMAIIYCMNRPFYSCVFSCFSHVNDAALMLISRNLQMKSSEVSIKTRSTPASLSFQGQATKHRTVKWSIQDEMKPWNQLVLKTKVKFMKKKNMRNLQKKLYGFSSVEYSNKLYKLYTENCLFKINCVIVVKNK